MHDLIAANRDRLTDACRRHGVRRLDLFGSAARGDDFDPATSDVDFFYEFDPARIDGLADRFFALHEELGRTLGRPVDLVSLADVTNPYFLQVANRHRACVYAA